MGPGRRMKKQGPPATLEQLGLASKSKRKNVDAAAQDGPTRKRKKTTDEPTEVAEPKKLVKLDRKIRQDIDESVAKKPKKAKKQFVNNDAQITVPPPMLIEGFEDEDDEDAPELVDGDLSDANFSQEEDEEVDEMALEDVSSGSGTGSDSVFDSDDPDAGQQKRGAMFSDDEDASDAEAQLTAANIEGLSRKLDQEQADLEADAQAELQDNALQTNIAADSDLLDTAGATTNLAPDLALIRNRITEAIRILSNFSTSNPTKSRSEYTDLLISDICTYYGYNEFLANKLFSLFSPSEAFAFFEANETPRPIVLRTNMLRTNRRTLAQSLINRGVVLQPVGKWSKVGLQIFEAPVPLGATPEYLAGHYILQAASSFLPVMALAPQPNERVLDMAAAPGGKTTYISALMRNTGAVFANDANRKRAKGLIGNIHRLGCKNVIVCNYDAQKAFPKILGGFDRILLDAPCSGTGVIGKDPSVKTSKNERDFLMLPHMQKQLLLAAIDSVDHASKTGGYVVYSTCSVTVDENESVVQYVLRKRPNVKIVETGLPEGFGTEAFKAFEGKKFDEHMNWARRWYPHKENVDGFFVCKLRKVGPSPKGAGVAGAADVNGEASVAINGVSKRAKGTSSAEESATDTKDDDDEFGGFDDEADEQVMQREERKRLRRKGLDPRTVGFKASGKAKTKSKSGSGTEEKSRTNGGTNGVATTVDKAEKKSLPEKANGEASAAEVDLSKVSGSTTLEKKARAGQVVSEKPKETKLKSKNKDKTETTKRGKKGPAPASGA
ncbi:ribosomal RNA small subunit methyltransferase B [Cyphellophora europaea CBS 101466]|uniref:Nucleolar protein 2 n=1 Tax=Cyphellophora europaea (strain CBS 101466) TaxID=1220924 RepID=W2S7C1_CYPE1|nr:ribosomal RNA small subunit methyltransferase B [Cyphellophora europaea CBS 101466]ETN44606.1 ribosomal RNA small subunit methyltransferase B [Cyphellophora europaea CBS 101466]